MSTHDRDPVILSACRTAVGKAPRGALRSTRPDELAAAVIGEALARVASLDPKRIDDVILGCAFPEASQGMNVARIAALRAGVPTSVPAQTVNRFCSSGLQSIALAADRIRAGSADVIVAGGAESMSAVPMGGDRFLPNPGLVESHPETYLGMGLTAERVAAEDGITREDQDAFALESHRRALAAVEANRFRAEIIPLAIEVIEPTPGGPEVRRFTFDRDEGPRAESSLEALARLRPVFRTGGTVTAGNSSQTSDGAGAVVVASRAVAEELGVRPLATFRGFAVAGVPPEIMGIGPVEAVPKLLERLGLTVADLDAIELNEAFAAQALAVIRRLGLDPTRVNPNGGAIALGHPLGATGAKLTATLLHHLERIGGRYGLVTMCVGGGMGAAGIFEREG
ncbi:MAG: acetyl-CoA C-acyltransferase [Planctomycetes bacterium]|nr:acetyl-CoA C-acyltransferase [Planctomycetota bacterium]